MTKTRLTSAIMVVAAVLVPFAAGATQGPQHFYTATAPNPCAAACPYWTDRSAETQWDTSCLANPLTVPGSFHDHPITVPQSDGGVRPKLITWTVTPLVDYDIVMCHANAQGIANGLHAGWSANQVDTPCNAGVPLIGCVEELSTPVSPGQKYVLRSYNWSDVQGAAAVYFYTG